MLNLLKPQLQPRLDLVHHLQEHHRLLLCSLEVQVGSL
jgi:hypothetical protein